MLDQDILLQILFGVIAALLSLFGTWITWKYTRGTVYQIFSHCASTNHL
jgi:hypothetical protein